MLQNLELILMHVITYIDSIIACAKPPDDKQELKELVGPQYHNLSRTYPNPLQPNDPSSAMARKLA